MTDGYNEELVEKSFANLKEHMIDHCYGEELLMQLYEYNNYEDHTKHHEDMINALNVFSTSYTQDTGNFDAVEFAQFIGDWLIIHIKYDVFEYRPFAHSQGLS